MSETNYAGVPFGRLNKTVGSAKMNFYRSDLYKPETKSPSRRDMIRAGLRKRKFTPKST